MTMKILNLMGFFVGECKQRFTTGKVPYVVKFNPDEDKQHMFLAGMQDKKIIQVCYTIFNFLCLNIKEFF